MTDGLTIEAVLPLSWVTRQATSQANVEMQRQSNVSLLRALASMEAIAPERELGDEATQKALERMESKLDIVMLLLAKLAAASGLLPSEKPLALRTDSLSWLEHEHAPTMGESVMISLYLNPRLPQPLLLSAQVCDLQNKDHGIQIEVKLEDAGEELQEWLTRTIFRYHRRQVQARRQP
ncbi:MAG: PilZ domain-containing protein [Methylophilales bacterium]|nr:PilZ domain-containing protein [Methylophilales bacterium]